MCGITGIIRFSGPKIERADIENLTSTLHHRGPDGSGTFINNTGNVALGHTRLAIFDLSNHAAQPMTDRHEKFTIVFNGEVYNFIELKEELRLLGHQFSTNGDTEVILTGLLEWGEAFFARMNGMWAILLWDHRQEQLIACRDRFGVKPLYFHNLQNSIIFSSETQSFGQFLPSRSINKKILSTTLRNIYYPESENLTIYSDCFSLEPGTLIRIDKHSNIQKVCWWSIEDHIPENTMNYSARKQRFEELFADACRLRMRSDARISTALSGGLDSSVVFAQCAEIALGIHGKSDSRQSTVSEPHTIGLTGTKWDETNYATAVAKMYETDIHVVQPSVTDFFDHIVENVRHFDNIWYMPDITHLVYRQMRQNGFRISIDGHGADEIFFGYPDMIDDYYGNSDTGIRHPELYQPSFLTPHLRRLRAKLETSINSLAGRRQRSPIWIFRDADNTTLYSGRQLARDQEISVNEIFHSRLPTILRNFDQSSMLSGIEVRSPFLDWRVVAFGLSLPMNDKFDRTHNKKIIRDSFKNRIPDIVLNRKDKIGIDSPLEYWTRRKPSMFLDMVHDQRFLESDVWNGPVIRDHMCAALDAGTMTRHDASRLWAILNAYMLMS